MHRTLFLLPVLFLLWCGPVASGTLAEFQFDDPARKVEFRSIIEEMRCLVCQNESLAGSNADLAHDLRVEIYEMFLAGKTKEEIIAFMVERYGDFVLYRPPFKPSTYPLWIGPVLLLIVAVFFLSRALRRKKKEPEAALSEQEQARLDELLKAGSESRQEEN